MSDIIQLLPDNVANQIAAGEVIQRPASVVKELVENAIDSGATEIKVIIKDAGKTSIKIIDNGCGMSDTDARLSFERHATSKIKKAEDLFAIRTMGFRGEALASIAAIAHVELKTKRTEEELGTQIEIEGSKVIKQESVSCPNGSIFSVKNLFFNIPARRKFLKSNQTELRHIIDEMNRVVLANPDISFYLSNNDVEIYNLPISNLRQRIVNVFSKSINQNLISLKTNTSIVNVSGFIGKPESAKKTGGQQFFFVNNRFMKHPYFYNAVCKAFENLLPAETKPIFFIYMSVDPQNIDVNIHPTKTEIKFEDEVAIWQILQATIKESLGKFNIFPSIDFELDQSISIQTISKSTTIKQPEIEIDKDYNPFDKEQRFTINKKQSTKGWEQLYSGFEKQEKYTETNNENKEDDILFQTSNRNFFQYKNKYIVTSIKSGLMFIDQKRAHERILFENYLKTFQTEQNISQRLLFPRTIEFSSSDAAIFEELINEVEILGFDIALFGKNTFIINGIPSDFNVENIEMAFENIIENKKSKAVDSKEEIREKLALSIAKSSSLDYSQQLSDEEMQNLFDNLFACKNPNHTHDGRQIISIIQNDEIEKRFS